MGVQGSILGNPGATLAVLKNCGTSLAALGCGEMLYYNGNFGKYKIVSKV